MQNWEEELENLDIIEWVYGTQGEDDYPCIDYCALKGFIKLLLKTEREQAIEESIDYIKQKLEQALWHKKDIETFLYFLIKTLNGTK